MNTVCFIQKHVMFIRFAHHTHPQPSLVLQRVHVHMPFCGERSDNRKCAPHPRREPPGARALPRAELHTEALSKAVVSCRGQASCAVYNILLAAGVFHRVKRQALERGQAQYVWETDSIIHKICCASPNLQSTKEKPQECHRTPVKWKLKHDDVEDFWTALRDRSRRTSALRPSFTPTDQIGSVAGKQAPNQRRDVVFGTVAKTIVSNAADGKCRPTTRPSTPKQSKITLKVGYEMVVNLRFRGSACSQKCIRIHPYFFNGHTRNSSPKTEPMTLPSTVSALRGRTLHTLCRNHMRTAMNMVISAIACAQQSGKAADPDNHAPLIVQMASITHLGTQKITWRASDRQQHEFVFVAFGCILRNTCPHLIFSAKTNCNIASFVFQKKKVQ